MRTGWKNWRKSQINCYWRRKKLRTILLISVIVLNFLTSRSQLWLLTRSRLCPFCSSEEGGALSSSTRWRWRTLLLAAASEGQKAAATLLLLLYHRRIITAPSRMIHHHHLLLLCCRIKTIKHYWISRILYRNCNIGLPTQAYASSATQTFVYVPPFFVFGFFFGGGYV